MLFCTLPVWLAIAEEADRLSAEMQQNPKRSTFSSEIYICTRMRSLVWHRYSQVTGVLYLQNRRLYAYSQNLSSWEDAELSAINRWLKRKQIRNYACLIDTRAYVCARARIYMWKHAPMNVEDDREKVIRRPADLGDLTKAFFYKRTRIVRASLLS